MMWSYLLMSVRRSAVRAFAWAVLVTAACGDFGGSGACDDDCVDALVAATRWTIEKAQQVTPADPRRMFLATDPSRPTHPHPQGVVPGSEQLETIARAAGLPAADGRERDWQVCLTDQAAPECQAQSGKTLIRLKEFRRVSGDRAVARPSVWVLGDVGPVPGNYVRESQLLLERKDGKWSVVEEEFVIMP